MPTGCQTVLVSVNASIRRGPGGAAQSSSAANTRLTLPAASRSSSPRPAAGTPVRSIALTSIWPASTGASSAANPVSTLTTPAGTSEVASTSASVTAGSGCASLAITTAAFPLAMTGASTLTRPSRLDLAGATTATTPVGSGTLKLKYGPATGLAEPATCAILSGQPAYQTHLSIATATARCASAAERPSFLTQSSVNCAARPSSSSATRYRTWPRLYAVAPDHFPNAARAAVTASLASLRDALAACASTPPSAPVTG